MPISLSLTPFDHFQIRLPFAVAPNLILEPCHKLIAGGAYFTEAFLGLLFLNLKIYIMKGGDP